MNNPLKASNQLIKSFVLLLVLISFSATAQTTIFSETFNEANTSTTGNSVEGIAWSTTCPGCLSGDFFAVVSAGQTLTAEDTNGPSTFQFTIPSATLSSYAKFDFVLNVTADVTTYESTGSNQDFVMAEYKFGAASYALLDSLNGNNVMNGMVSAAGIPIVAGDLSIQVTVQNWAHVETISFNDVTITAESILPVELIDFTVNKTTDEKAELKWVTATETNNKNFIVEKRSNTGRFEEIGTLEGAGNSDEYIDYVFVDKTPLNGVNYYRLTQVDWDGSKKQSHVVSIQMGHTGKIKLFPTTTSSEININVEEPTGTYYLNLFNMNGKLIRSEIIEGDDSNIKMDVNSLPSGPYFIKINSGNSTETLRFFRS